MREGDIGHTRSTVLDACVTQRAKHALGWGWGAIRITGRDSDAHAVVGRDSNAHAVVGRNLDAARILGRDSDARRALSVQMSPENARNVRISPKNAGYTPKPSHKRARKHTRGRTYPYVLSYSIHHTKRRDTPARRAAIAHAVMRSDSAKGGPWRTTPYKKIACA